MFTHLHLHTEYSLLDGMTKMAPLMERVKSLGMEAVAMTDHGNVFGAFDFYSKATAAGVKPIIGMEAYFTPNTSRYERKRVRWNDGGDDDVSGSGAYTHMTLLAESTVGMHNLFRLSSRASMEGFFYNPRADRELLAEHATGLIGTTGCPSGEVQTWLRIGDYAKARQAAADFQAILGRDSYFLELMDHGLDIENRVREGLLKLGKGIDAERFVKLQDLIRPQARNFHQLQNTGWQFLPHGFEGWVGARLMQSGDDGRYGITHSGNLTKSALANELIQRLRQRGQAVGGAGIRPGSVRIASSEGGALRKLAQQFGYCWCVKRSHAGQHNRGADLQSEGRRPSRPDHLQCHALQRRLARRGSAA